jgi:hypothetical protein
MDARLADITDSAATMLAALGEKLPEFIANLGFRERVVAVGILDSIVQPPDAVYECFISQPREFGAALSRDPATLALLKTMGTVAKEEMNYWTPDKLLNVFAALTDLTVSESKRPEAQASRMGMGDFFAGATAPYNGWGI